MLVMNLINVPECLANRFDFYWMFGSKGPLYIKVAFVSLLSWLIFFPLSLTPVFKLTEYFNKKTIKEGKPSLSKP